MPLRPPAGFIRPGFDPLKNPNAPTIGTATAGDTSASVSFTPPANVGGSAISQYQVVAYTGGAPVGNTTGTASPINATGLTNGTSYTFAVWALNTYGPGPFSAMSNSVTPAVQTRGLIAGAYTNVIEYLIFETLGNTSDFGDLTTNKGGCVGLFNTTRMVISAGSETNNNMDYVTIASTGNASDFGDQANPTNNGTSGCSSSTRGVIGGGNRSSGRTASMTYITTATLGNDTTFGNLLNTVDNLSQGCSNGTRGVLGVAGFANSGPDGSSSQNIIQYITIASTGNALDFGDTAGKSFIMGVAGSDTRGVISVKSPDSNSIGYITIATTGNTIDFGDLNFNTGDCFALSNKTRAIFSNSGNNTLDYITIATTGNAVDFGDRNTAAMSGGQVACGSGGQGGL